MRPGFEFSGDVSFKYQGLAYGADTCAIHATAAFRMVDRSLVMNFDPVGTNLGTTVTIDAVLMITFDMCGTQHPQKTG